MINKIKRFGILSMMMLGMLCIGAPQTVFASDDPFELSFKELAPGVWSGVRKDNPRFPVMGTATFVISDEGVVVFDPQGKRRKSKAL